MVVRVGAARPALPLPPVAARNRRPPSRPFLLSFHCPLRWQRAWVCPLPLPLLRHSSQTPIDTLSHLHRFKLDSKFFSTPTPTGSVDWHRPLSLEDLMSHQRRLATAEPGTVKFVCGNTTLGVEKCFTGTHHPIQYKVRWLASSAV